MSKVGGFKTPSGWGPRSGLGGTYKMLLDHLGNRDGLWDNEDRMAGDTGSLFDRQPLLLRAKTSASVGLSTDDEVATLTRFVSEAEANWDTPTVDPQVLATLDNPKLYGAQKAVVLSNLDRHPSEVTEHIVHAAGTVDGQPIASRDVFTQLWAAQGVPSGRVVVLSPGFQETWLDFTEQIQMLNGAGHDVLMMDHQWAGQTQGDPGGLDRGFGAARDVAAVAAKAAALAKERHGENGVVILAGNSMGAGPGVAGAAVMNAAGRLELEGDAMPKGLRTAISDPFFGASPRFINDVLAVASHVPIVNDLAVYSAGAPVLTHDPVALQKGAQNAVLQDTRAQLSTMTKALPDLATIQSVAAQTPGAFGRLIVVHATQDPLADPALAESFVKSVGDGAKIRWVDSKDHVMQLSPSQQHHLVDAINELAGEPDGFVATPHFDVRLDSPLTITLDESALHGPARFEVLLKDLPLAPLGPREFAESLQNVGLTEPWAADESATRFEVHSIDGEPTLVIEADLAAGVLEQSAPMFNMQLSSGQNINMVIEAPSIEYDTSAYDRTRKQDRLGSQQRLLKALIEHQARLTKPRAESSHLPELRADLETASKRVHSLRARLDARLNEMDPALRIAAFTSLKLVTNDAPLQKLVVNHRGSYSAWYRVEQKAKEVEGLALSFEHHGIPSGDARKELVGLLRKRTRLADDHQAALDALLDRVNELDLRDRVLDFVHDAQPLTDEPRNAYRRARRELRHLEQDVEILERDVGRPPVPSDVVAAEIETVRAAIQELEQVV